jgi:hypothetical protein
MVDSAWAGVVGAVVGGAIGSLTSLVAPLVNWKTERKRIDCEHKNELEKLDRQRELDERTYKRGLILKWRMGIATASPSDLRSALTAGWFEELRPFLSDDVIARFSEPRAVYVAPETPRGFKDVLAAEVDRIEREWGLRPGSEETPSGSQS